MRSNFYRAVLPVLAAGSLVMMGRSASASLLLADGFDYTASTVTPPSTAYLSGNADSDFSALNPPTWDLAGAAGTDPTVAASNTVYPGPGAPPSLPGANSAQINASSGSDRITSNVLTAPLSYSNSGGTSLYYSFTIEVTNDAALANASTVTGAYVAGFNNTSGANSTLNGSSGATLCLRYIASGTNEGDYQIGIAQSPGTGGNRIFGSTDYAVGDTLFVVGAYNFGTAAASDTSTLYAFDGGSDAAIPSSQPTASSTGVAIVDSPYQSDISIESFFLRDNNTSVIANIDDLRIGTTWADVVPPVPEPASLSLLGLGALAGLVRRRRA